MPDYNYRGVNHTGKGINGIITDPDLTALESGVADAETVCVLRETEDSVKKEPVNTNISIISDKASFTLIEMIGVISIISILASFVAPKVLDAIHDSKVTRLAAEIKTYTDGVNNWYKDIRSLNSLNATGAVVSSDSSFQDELIANQGTTPTSGRWRRWEGPYIDSVTSTSIGTTLRINSSAGNSGTGVPIAFDVTAFDLNDDQANDMVGKQVVSITLTGTSNAESIKLDSILDKGFNSTNRAVSGRVKFWSGGKFSTPTLYIYLTSI
ncbi:MAG: hypothetical protein GY941_28640 [Planctomycetes bacterium]|nr:hypothetical protein [Planctomycetota bacterium]